jgi:hypothetical protein
MFGAGDHHDDGYPPREEMSNTMRSIFYVDQLDCAAEEQLIGKRLSLMTEVKGVEFDIVNRRVFVTHDGGVCHTLTRHDRARQH